MQRSGVWGGKWWGTGGVHHAVIWCGVLEWDGRWNLMGMVPYLVGGLPLMVGGVALEQELEKKGVISAITRTRTRTRRE